MATAINSLFRIPMFFRGDVCCENLSGNCGTRKRTNPHPFCAYTIPSVTDWPPIEIEKAHLLEITEAHLVETERTNPTPFVLTRYPV